MAIAAARAASIAGRQRGSGRAGSRHLAAGSRLRLRACRVGSAALELLRQRRRADCRGLSELRSRAVALAAGGRSMGDGLSMVSVPVASRQDSSLLPCPDLPLANPVANAPFGSHVADAGRYFTGVKF